MVHGNRQRRRVLSRTRSRTQVDIKRYRHARRKYKALGEIVRMKIVYVKAKLYI